MTDTLEPVERTNWMYRPGILPLTGMMSLRLGCMVRIICGQLRTSCDHLARLKRLKIKRGATLKVNSILLLSPVLLNKSGLVQAKVGNFNLKFLNRCFSNYYQV